MSEHRTRNQVLLFVDQLEKFKNRDSWPKYDDVEQGKILVLNNELLPGIIIGEDPVKPIVWLLSLNEFLTNDYWNFEQRLYTNFGNLIRDGWREAAPKKSLDDLLFSASQHPYYPPTSNVNYNTNTWHTATDSWSWGNQ